MKSEESFLLGIKPALITTDHYEFISHLKTNYPYYVLQKRESFSDYLFFQDKEKMHSFLNQVNGTSDSQNPKHIQALGICLGFPPEAVHYFLIAGSRMYERVGLHYMGIHCAGSIDKLINNVLWLWNKYPFPELDKLQVIYEVGSIRQEIQLDYEDRNSLQLFHRVLLNSMNLMKTYENSLES